jgi:hypothetical protein
VEHQLNILLFRWPYHVRRLLNRCLYLNLLTVEQRHLFHHSGKLAVPTLDHTRKITVSRAVVLHAHREAKRVNYGAARTVHLLRNRRHATRRDQHNYAFNMPEYN